MSHACMRVCAYEYVSALQQYVVRRPHLSAAPSQVLFCADPEAKAAQPASSAQSEHVQ